VNYIGKININLFKVVTENITTDDVVITDERIKHINDNHSNDYDRFSSFILEILTNPDYILKDNKNENTAIILKKYLY